MKCGDANVVKMSSSIATAVATSPNSTMSATGANSVVPNLAGNRPPAAAAATAIPVIPPMAAQFREIHKNTWLKRLTAEGKKVFVGPKKSERSWVVFCVHDDTEALLEGYAEPRQAPSHNPEWIVSMQDTLHISHALIPNSHEFEFVVTLSNEVVRFHAMSWDIMQEWVETLRSKLREMKILSPRENLYTKLPEVRVPLLPTRDPTSPLPAPPPVPAAIVPGVERVIPSSGQQQLNDESSVSESRDSIEVLTPITITSSTTSTSDNLINNTSAAESTPSTSIMTTTITSTSSTTLTTYNIMTTTPLLTSMSNTLTQNLLNMLSDPISAYSEQLNDANSSSSSIEMEDDLTTAATSLSLALDKDLNFSDSQSTEDEYIGPLLRKPSVNTSDLNTSASCSNSVRLDVLAAHRASADQIRILENILQCERRIPRPHTSRSLSAGAVDKSKLNTNIHLKNEELKKANPSLMLGNTNCRGNNITELEVNSDFETSQVATAAPVTSTTTTTSADSKANITIIQVSTDIKNDDNTSTSDSDYEPPTVPHKSINAEIFTFPDMHVAASTATRTKNSLKQHEYKSNVQIIPSGSNNSSHHHNHHISSTIQVVGSSSSLQNTRSSAVGNQYTTPVKRPLATAATSATTSDELSKITTVHVAGSDNTYGTCFTPPSSVASASASLTSTPKLPKKIILSANTSGITNISVNNTNDETAVTLRNNSARKELEKAINFNRSNSLHYEKVFLSSTSTSTSVNTSVPDVSSVAPSTSQQHGPTPMSPKWNSPLRQVNQSKLKVDSSGPPVPQSEAANGAVTVDKKQKQPVSKQNNGKSVPSVRLDQQSGLDQVKTSTKVGSPAMQRCKIVSPSRAQSTAQIQRPPFILTRGLTEAVITSRPSRRDFHFLNKLSSTKSKLPQHLSSNANANSKSSAVNSNNNGDVPGPSTSTQTPTHMAINRTTSDAIEQRRRSSSTSDAQAQRNSRGANNNEFSSRANCAVGGAGGALRQPPQPFRPSDNLLSGGPNTVHNSSTTSPAKRMTLREQQVMQLRREIMHPGGVRLQLRRKDCVGSIAWVDAFGAVWVAGWKQKEHPVLYNALHIGDQLLSIAGVTISSAAEANKIIRNTNTLFVEVLVRRIPFGRGYAIRREREGQCLGLIRDGNTATIVDVVPNSLAARHGLPPKAQSCDGTTLTFWVLTEINGRPLNLFFKDNEIRDRLNSVGRDISILVQPSDLITKLKKQLKSLRGYKDYLVQ